MRDRLFLNSIFKFKILFLSNFYLMEELIKVEEQGLEGSFAKEFRESSVKKKYKT